MLPNTIQLPSNIWGFHGCFVFLCWIITNLLSDFTQDPLKIYVKNLDFRELKVKFQFYSCVCWLWIYDCAWKPWHLILLSQTNGFLEHSGTKGNLIFSNVIFCKFRVLLSPTTTGTICIPCGEQTNMHWSACPWEFISDSAMMQYSRVEYSRIQ